MGEQGKWGNGRKTGYRLKGRCGTWNMVRGACNVKRKEVVSSQHSVVSRVKKNREIEETENW